MKSLSHLTSLPADAQALCDPETGVCAIPGTEGAAPSPAAKAPLGEVLYVGDPMCSWCWGISPGLRALQDEALRRGLPFRILVGGLRPGGGDAWNERFRSFLRHHWEEIGERSGQPFSTRFLDRESFNYDTEPACRAFVVMRGMLEEKAAPSTQAYEVFAAIQRKFYAEGEDPTVASFYEPLCVAQGLDPREFRDRFDAPQAKQATAKEFEEVRRLGVRGFPTVLFEGAAGRTVLATGFATGTQLVDALGHAAKQQTRAS